MNSKKDEPKVIVDPEMPTFNLPLLPSALLLWVPFTYVTKYLRTIIQFFYIYIYIHDRHRIQDAVKTTNKDRRYANNTWMIRTLKDKSVDQTHIRQPFMSSNLENS